MDNNNALLERLEKVIDTLSDNSIKMGQMLAVHDEKLDKHATDIKKGCERDIMLVDKRLRTIEKKMWSIFGALSIISFIVSPIGQRFIRPLLTPPAQTSIIDSQ